MAAALGSVDGDAEVLIAVDDRVDDDDDCDDDAMLPVESETARRLLMY